MTADTSDAPLLRETAMMAQPSKQEFLRTAFWRSDRHCRQYAPTARDLLARAELARALGFGSASERDLLRASEIDPTDPAVNAALLRWGPVSTRYEACQRLLADRGASNELADEALAWLSSNGCRLAHRLTYVNGKRMVGSAAWGDVHTLRMEVDTASGRKVHDVLADARHSWSRFGRAADIDIREDDDILEVRLLVDGGVQTRLPNPHVRISWAPERTKSGDEGMTDHVLVVVPVFADLAATKSCLEALAQQRASIDIRVVVVDDASPDPELRAYLDLASRNFGFTLVRLARNLGFVGAVNQGLVQHYRGGDVLLLNADAVLPEGAVHRLRRAVYSKPGVGTATPFSNNGEFTSFPASSQVNPMPDLRELAALDKAFRKANAGVAIPLPSGVGFCLYIRRQCFDSVGLLSQLYAPGYGEDAEFCLMARAHGFLNVCAADVFVAHAGSRSFRSAKRALVKRNLRIMEARFPEFRAECAAFLHADPLRLARARAELEMSANDSALLLISGSRAHLAAANARAMQIRKVAPETRVVTLRPSSQGAWELRGLDGAAPQSLVFDASRAAPSQSLIAYLRAARIARVELIGVGEMSDEAFALASGPGAPVDVVCADAWPLAPPASRNREACPAAEGDEPCERCRERCDLTSEAKGRFRRTLARLNDIVGAESRVLPLDRLGSAFAPFAFGRLPKVDFVRAPLRAGARFGVNRTLAILAPTVTPAVDAFLVRLGRAIKAARLDVSAVVFGACLNDDAVMSSAALRVTGPMDVDEYKTMLELYEVGLLLSPYRNSHHWVFDMELPDLPKGYFDWSFGAAWKAESDLAMDPRSCDEKAARQVVSWLRRQGGAARTRPLRGDAVWTP